MKVPNKPVFYLTLVALMSLFRMELGAHASTGYVIPPLRGADQWYFEIPAKGQPAKKENRWMVMLWRADKWRESETWRYYPHITSREYFDCSYYKYVDCRDSRFCRCWQCRNHYYPEDAEIDGWKRY